AAWPAAPVVAVPRPPRSPLGPLTLSAAVLAVGVLLLARAAGLQGVTPPRVLATALLVVGLGLVAGTWVGRARWLLLPGLLLVVATLLAAVVQGPYGWTTGTRTWVPAAEPRTHYRLGAGEATLDLRGLEPGELGRVQVQVGAGHLVVLLPDALPARVDTHVDAGDVVQRRPDGTLSHTVDATTDAAGRPTVLDLSVRAGRIEVRRVAA
ncbi:MAG: phage shock protein PspC, partial [Frankiales bacterium]|nr:phage shock protein PspC [Frankiales bacterium]